MTFVQTLHSLPARTRCNVGNVQSDRTAPRLYLLHTHTGLFLYYSSICTTNYGVLPNASVPASFVPTPAQPCYAIPSVTALNRAKGVNILELSTTNIFQQPDDQYAAPQTYNIEPYGDFWQVR